MEVWWASFKPVLSFEVDRLLAACCLVCTVKSIEGLDFYSFFRLIKRWHVRCGCHGWLVIRKSQRYVKCTSNMRKYKSSLIRLPRWKYLHFLICNLSFALFYLLNSVAVSFKLLALEILNSNIGWRYVFMKSSFAILLVFEHGFLPLRNLFLVNQEGLNFVFDNRCHRGSHRSWVGI